MARGDGEGTIYQRKDGRWCGQVTIGIDPKTGKPKRKTFYGKKRKDVIRRMTDLKKRLFSGDYFEPSNMELGYWLERWIEGRKSTIARNTYLAYKSVIKNHINPEFGSMRLKELKARDIQNLLNSKLESGRKDGEKGGLSHRSVKYIYTTLHTALKQAVKERFIIRNVCEAVEIPKKQEENEMRTWTKKEVSFFLNTARRYKYFILYYLALNTGMRQGELLGLEWKDIDSDNKLLKVHRQYDRSGDLKKLKSKAGNRTIPLTDQVVKELKRHKTKQDEKKLALAKAFNNQDLVCCDEIGNPISHSKLYKEFKIIIEEAELPEIAFHDMRHTFATLFIEANGPIKTLQQILGHSSITITIDTYVSVTNEMINSAVNIMETMYKTDKKKKHTK